MVERDARTVVGQPGMPEIIQKTLIAALPVLESLTEFSAIPCPDSLPNAVCIDVTLYVQSFQEVSLKPAGSHRAVPEKFEIP